MKKNIILIAMLTLSVFWCDSNKDRCDKEFRNMYRKALQSVEIDYTHRIGKKTSYNGDNSHIFLGHITNHFSQRHGTHFGLMYLSKKDYLYDVHMWKKWYEEKGCYYSMKKADSVFFTLNLQKETVNSWKEYLSQSRGALAPGLR
jgi:hypothetical protein